MCLFMFRISWALQNMSSSCALMISLIYWTALHPYVVKYHLMSSAWQSFLNVFLHGLNSVSFFIDILVTSRPVRIHHFYFGLLFGIYYMIFSLVYWVSGGTGRCAVRCWSLVTNITTTTTTYSTMTPTTITSSSTMAPWSLNITSTTTSPCDVVVCDDFIYPILDWSSHPAMAVLTVLLGMVGMPVVQLFWWGCYKIRLLVWSRGGRRDNIDIYTYTEHREVRMK